MMGLKSSKKKPRGKTQAGPLDMGLMTGECIEFQAKFPDTGIAIARMDDGFKMHLEIAEEERAAMMLCWPLNKTVFLVKLFPRIGTVPSQSESEDPANQD